MKLTTLFRLRKPDGTDPVNIEDFNDNFDVIDEELGKRLESTGAASDMTVAFEQASTRTNLKTGEKISVSFGKIMKWFADLKAVAFSGSYSDLSNQPTIPSGAAASQAVANNCTTTAAGSVLDARQGKVLMDKANQLSSELNNKSSLKDRGGDNSVSFDWNGEKLDIYVDGQKVFSSTHDHTDKMDKNPPNVELFGDTPYVDFHFGKSKKDYTSRIIEQNEGKLDVYAPNGFNVESGNLMSASRPVAVKSNNMLTDCFQSFAYPGPVFIPYGASSTNTPDDSTSGIILYVPVDDWKFRVAFTSNGNIFTSAQYRDQAPAWPKTNK